MKDFFTAIVCKFFGHNFRRTVSHEKGYDTWVCTRCGKVQKIAKTTRW